MKARFTDRPEKFNINHRKENFAGLDTVYKVIDNKFNELVDCRIYWSSTFSTCYCCLWVTTENKYLHGSGSAGGYGYCKKSAAVANAINNCGIDLSKNISGVGTSAIEEALLSISRELTKNNIAIIKSHA